jgi:hypothetical protein
MLLTAFAVVISLLLPDLPDAQYFQTLVGVSIGLIFIKLDDIHRELKERK